MQILESQWLRARLARIPDEQLFPLLDVGSSTLHYRTEEQPWVDENIHAPLRARGGRVLHADLKSAPGIEFAGDLLDPGFVRVLGAQAPRTALVSNILHHVQDRAALCRSIQRIVRPGGWVLVSGPHRYPRHFDPIDTMWRPDVVEVASLFPGSELVESAVIDAGNWRTWNAKERGGRSLARTLARLCVPVYRPRKWLEVAYQAPYVFKHIQSFAVVLRLP